jgi:hypothetical protein
MSEASLKTCCSHFATAALSCHGWDMTNDPKNPQALNEILVQDEKLLLVDDLFGWEKARQTATDYKVKAMGMFSQLLFRPKPEDISIVYEEKRYQAFWHIVGTLFLDYRRKARHKVPVDTMVKTVLSDEQEYTVSQTDHTFEIEVMEYCQETQREEFFVDAQTEKPGDFAKYMKANGQQIKNMDILTRDGAQVVNLQAKASFLVRQMLNKLVRPYKADEIIDERIAIEELSLYFYPLYTFEYLWANKDKKAIVEFDGVTGEMRKGQKISDKLLKSFSYDEMFDFAKEIATFVPGGGLAMMTGKKAYQIAKNAKLKR